MPAIRRTKLVELLWRLHRWTFLKSGGRLGARLLGQPILLLTTLGRKSGLPRPVTLYHFRDQDGYVVIASHAGEPRHPAWYLNLVGNPQAIVQVGPRRWQVRATTAEGEERERLWARAVEFDRSYAEYEQRTERQIPVVVLTPEAELS